jgi:hypothetical protein
MRNASVSPGTPILNAMSVSGPNDPGGERDAREIRVDHAQGTQVGDHGVQDNRSTPVTAGRDALVAGRDINVENLHVHLRESKAPFVVDQGLHLQEKRGGFTGRLLAEVTDPFGLEVHRPISLEGREDLPELPLYVTREHDRELAGTVQSAVAGTSGIAVLVGGSSTGKTRACWEALQLLRGVPPSESWRLWHPIDPSRPGAALRELPSIGPRTVVWLNEAQFYLDGPDGVGEQVAAGLRALLRDPARGPVLVLATLWPEYWFGLTSRPSDGALDVHAQARELLAGRDISVPTAFSNVQSRRITRSDDPPFCQTDVTHGIYGSF